MKIKLTLNRYKLSRSSSIIFVCLQFATLKSSHKFFYTLHFYFNLQLTWHHFHCRDQWIYQTLISDGTPFSQSCQTKKWALNRAHRAFQRNHYSQLPNGKINNRPRPKVREILSTFWIHLNYIHSLQNTLLFTFHLPRNVNTFAFY